MSTYQDLNLAVQALLNEASTELDAYMPTAVRLAEQGIFQSFPTLACFKTMKMMDGTPAGGGKFNLGIASTPTDNTNLEIIRTVSAAWTDDNGNAKTALLEKKVDDFAVFWGNSPGDPQFYTERSRTATGITLEVFPTENRLYQFTVRGFGETEKLNPNQNDSQTWLSVNAYDCLLYGTAMHAATFLKDMELTKLYMQQYQNCMQMLATQNRLQYDTEADSGSDVEEA